MNIPMRVHRVSSHPVDVEVVFNGEKARASLPELEIELTSDDGHGSHALRFRSSAEIAAAKALFSPGSTVMMTYATAGPAVINTEADPASDTAA